jgi:HEXXH motif-containing protein
MTSSRETGAGRNSMSAFKALTTDNTWEALHSEGEAQASGLRRLRAAELGKHKAILATIVRIASARPDVAFERTLGSPYRLLAEVEGRAPGVTESVLALPQFGAWADYCFRRLIAPASEERDAVPLTTELGHLALLAATAAMRAGMPFRLEVPLREGAATFPGLGTARPGAREPWEWGLAWQAADGWRVCSSVSTTIIPSDLTSAPAWKPTLRCAFHEDGLRLDVQVDDADPFLDRYPFARVKLTRVDSETWCRLFAQAWRTLASTDRPLAALVGGLLQVAVPVAAPGPTRRANATEASSFGAIALTLPPDALSMAEILVHECHHAALGALLDVEPMVRADASESGFLAYAPWREDPRPAGALLQGIAAHHGMGLFWRRQYLAGASGDRLRAATEFGRLRVMTARAASALNESGLLTGAGREFLAGVQRDAADWLDEPLPARALEHAADLMTDHEARWRIAHLVPSPDGILALADAWTRGDAPPLSPDEVSVRLQPGPPLPVSANMRSYLLGLQFREPATLAVRLAADDLPPDQADLALVRGEDGAAAAGYLRRIAAREDPDAWAGLAIARRRTGPEHVAPLYASRPELLSALHAQVRAGTGSRDEMATGADAALPDRLASWLTGP